MADYPNILPQSCARETGAAAGQPEKEGKGCYRCGEKQEEERGEEVLQYLCSGR